MVSDKILVLDLILVLLREGVTAAVGVPALGSASISLTAALRVVFFRTFSVAEIGEILFQPDVYLCLSCVTTLF